MRITATDRVNNSSNEVSDNQFTIDSTVPTVPANTLTAPNGGEAWKQGTARNIMWNNAAITDNFGLAANPITLEYSTDGTNWNAIASGEANDGTYAWTTPMIDSTTVRVRITATDAAGLAATDVSDTTFSIGLPPVIVQARAVSNTLIEVEWNKSLASAGPFGNYTATGITPTTAAVSGGNNTIVNLTVNALNNTGFTAADLAVVANTVTDTFNFQNEAASGVAIIDKQAPQFSLGASYPNQNQLIVDARPGLRLAVSEAPGGSTVLTLDAAGTAYTYNAPEGIITFTPAAALAFGKHTLALDLIDAAGNAAPSSSWNFWIDSFTFSITATPVSFVYNGNVSDETGIGEDQNISVSTFGAGFGIFARFNPDFTDGVGNTITDVDIKQSAQAWGSKIDLNGTNLVQIVNVPKPALPNDATQVSNYSFDIRATIPGILQAAGTYAGTLEFVVVPEY
ncbi:MAG: hypothetical protein HY462_00435 [Parcubacteria group bacterium]|nr:hypothetical protein [Parcubacteria group bacterium]